MKGNKMGHKSSQRAIQFGFFLLIPILILGIETLLSSRALGGYGPGGSGGGYGLILKNQVYLLEFVESGLHEKANMKFGKIGRLKKPQQPEEAAPAHTQIAILKYPDHEEYRSVADDRSFSMLNTILAASNAGNQFLFGKKLSDCKEHFRLCLSPEAEIAIAIVNRFGQPDRFEDKNAMTAFLDKLIHLNWFLVDAPLSTIDDANSPVDIKDHILLARRDGQNISIYKGFWNRGVKIGGQKI